MKVVIAQLNPTVGAIDANVAEMLKVIDGAKFQGADLVVFPEMAVSGYPPKDLLLLPQFVNACLAANETLKDTSTEDCVVVWGNILKHTLNAGPPLHNAAYCAKAGDMVAIAKKTHLPTYDVFDEARYFAPAPAGNGVTSFSHGGKNLVVSICEDLWGHPLLTKKEQAHIAPVAYGTDPFSGIDMSASDMVLNLSASPYVQGKPALRQELLKKLAHQLGVTMVYVNQVGANDDLIFDGSSSVTDPTGKQWSIPSFETHCECVDLSASIVSTASDMTPEEELIDALTLGIRDYVYKTGFKTVFIGLSGGLDSSLTAVLAQRALGADSVVGVAMPGPYSSTHSVEDARLLAENLGIEYRELAIDASFEVYVEALSGGLPQQDLAEQNLQARLRGLCLMTLANREGALVLTTGNKSEVAMGYCTLYGDTCGALAPIGDVFKTEAYALCTVLNHQAGHSLIPERVLEKPPSAELAPNQKDEDSLPPYAVLDPILHEILQNNLGFEDLLCLGYDENTILQVLHQLMRNEFKRQQQPPSLKVSHKAFGSGRTYPIVQRFRFSSPSVGP